MIQDLRSKTYASKNLFVFVLPSLIIITFASQVPLRIHLLHIPT
ncbi:hypothetical protein X975_13255, partial [Stegodyphus mimosarum]